MARPMPGKGKLPRPEMSIQCGEDTYTISMEWGPLLISASAKLLDDAMVALADQLAEKLSADMQDHMRVRLWDQGDDS